MYYFGKLIYIFYLEGPWPLELIFNFEYGFTKLLYTLNPNMFYVPKYYWNNRVFRAHANFVNEFVLQMFQYVLLFNHLLCLC